MTSPLEIPCLNANTFNWRPWVWLLVGAGWWSSNIIWTKKGFFQCLFTTVIIVTQKLIFYSSYDFNTSTEKDVGKHESTIRCVEFCSETSRFKYHWCGNITSKDSYCRKELLPSILLVMGPPSFYAWKWSWTFLTIL